MSEFVFILGAGASKEANAPLMIDFLDVAERLRRERNLGEMSSDFDLVFRARNSLRPAYSHVQIDLARNVESVFAAFEMAKLIGRLGPLDRNDVEKLPHAMRRLIEKTLADTIEYPVDGETVKPPRPYDDFAELLWEIVESDKKSYEKVTVITFNYDLCLDYAFHYSSMPVNYCLSREETLGIKLLKLHGSLNWIACPKCKKVVPWHLKDFFRVKRWNVSGKVGKTVKLNMSEQFGQFQHCADAIAKSPFVIPPTWNKTQYHQHIDRVWAAAATELHDAVNVIVCGYSLPESDHFFKYLLALGSLGDGYLERFLVFNPDGAVKDRFEGIVGPLIRDRFNFSEAVFSGAINMAARLCNIRP